MDRLKRISETPTTLPSPLGTSSPDEVNQILKELSIEPSQGKRPKKERIPYGCEKCDGFGNVITEKGALPCECKLRYFAEQRILRANIPPLFADKDLSNYARRGKAQQSEFRFASMYVQNYSAKDNKGLLLVGEPGVGKTHIAVGILKELIGKGFTGLYFNVIALLDAIKASYDKEIKATQGLDIQADLDVDILLLDDLGAEKMSPWVADRLYAIINQRYETQRTLILTTNLKYDKLGDQVGQRILSRLYEMCILHPFRGEDYRFKHKSEIKEV
jgi:DNA replication protein DnaC